MARRRADSRCDGPAAVRHWQPAARHHAVTTGGPVWNVPFGDRLGGTTDTH